jgi:D-threo-aldose 1-dehydrogenase
VSFPAVATGPFGFGTAPLGGMFSEVSDDDAAQALAAAWAGGVRYFDTAPHYGAGVAERRLGAFLRDKPRDEFVVSTKVGRIIEAGESDEPIFVGEVGRRIRDYSRDGVLRSLHDSVERSGLDRFDLVLIHDPDDHWAQAVGETYPALVELRDQGVVDAIGVGMNTPDMLARFVRETDIDVVLVAGRYTLLERQAADDLLPLCQDRGVTVIAAGVFNTGVLAAVGPDTHFNYAPAPAEILDRTENLRAICTRHGVPLPAAALAFPRRHPAVTAVLVGLRDANEVATDLELAAWDIPPGLWADLERQ